LLRRSHPFSHWRDQLITQASDYQEIVKDMQQLARANLIFGLHVHVAFRIGKAPFTS